MTRRGVGGGTASATAAVGNDVPRASRSVAAAFFARMDVRRAAVTMAGAAMLSHWRLREQMLDSRIRGKMSFFQIASGPILSIPIYLKTCLYGPCKFPLKKNDQNLPAGHVKVLIFCRTSG